MKNKVLLMSQRVDIIEYQESTETRECLDVRLTKLVDDLGFIPVPVSSSLNDINLFVSAIKPNGLILTGGNDINSCKKRDAMEEHLLYIFQKEKLPVLGICRGMQMINNFQGGDLVPINNHIRCSHVLYGEKLFENLQVNSYHSQGITEKTLGKDLICLARSGDGIVESLTHKYLPWLGIMWHPERNDEITDFDLKLLYNLFTPPHAIDHTCSRYRFKT